MLRGRPSGSGDCVKPAAGWHGLLARWIGRILGGCCLWAAAASAALGASNNVRITSLTDIAFGTVSNLSADAIQSESLCVYANTATNGYNVRAFGSGGAGAFTLASGADTLPFEVQWSPSAGQSSGVQLSPNVALSGQVTSATQQTCNSGPATSASLVVILRTAALSSAAAGSYSGSLTLVIGPE
jgi:hypothetical protein